MSNYIVQGKLGGGKTLCAVGRIKDYLLQGRRVATNLDMDLEKLLGPKFKDADVTRLPDKPSLEHLEMLGYGCEEEDYTETKSGALVLDELGTWFNSRGWNDKARQPVINYLLHLRKLRWDGFFIVQDVDMVDKQLRSALGEHLVTCRRLDRYKMPVIGHVAGWFGFKLNMPKVHVGLVTYGTTANSTLVDRWWYRGNDLYDAYETKQLFQDGKEFPCIENEEKLEGYLDKDGMIDARSVYTYLSPWLTHGRYLEPPKQFRWENVLLAPAVLIAKLISRVCGRSPDSLLINFGLKKPTKPLETKSRDYYLSDSNTFDKMSTKELNRYIRANPNNEYIL